MTQDEAFLAAICEDPADDTPRLIYADWLEERGDGARAEFIRVQVALDDYLPRHDEACSECGAKQGALHKKGALHKAGCRLLALRTREQELLALIPVAMIERRIVLALNSPDPLFTYRRGFLARIDLPTQSLLDHAAELFRQPITEVRLTDREPDDWQDSWCWYKAGRVNPHGLPNRADIPIKLWPPWLGIDQVLRRFATRDLALAALSSWCVDYGRRTVGLPRFPQECPDCGGTGRRESGQRDEDGETSLVHRWPCLRCKATPGWIEPV